MLARRAFALAGAGKRCASGGVGTVSVKGGEPARASGHMKSSDAIAVPIVQTAAYTFKDSQQLIDFNEGRYPSYEYGRYGNPTVRAVEQKMMELEGAEDCLASTSGMYTAVSMMMALLPEGSRVITTTDCYRRTRQFLNTVINKMGVTNVVIPPGDLDALRCEVQRGAAMFFSESPSNPMLRCVDIPAASQICRAAGTILCIDGTFSTPYNQRPLDLGADIVIHSATKYLAGHHDVLAGVLAGRKDLVEQVVARARAWRGSRRRGRGRRRIVWRLPGHRSLRARAVRSPTRRAARGVRRAGACIARRHGGRARPSCGLSAAARAQNAPPARGAAKCECGGARAHAARAPKGARGAARLPHAAARHRFCSCSARGAVPHGRPQVHPPPCCASARRTPLPPRSAVDSCARHAHLAAALEQVKKTIYPSLPHHPDHAYATAQARGFGGVVSFELHGGLHAGAMFTDTLQMPHIAPSLGGCDSLVEQPTVRPRARARFARVPRARAQRDEAHRRPTRLHVARAQIISYWNVPPDERNEIGIQDGLCLLYTSPSPRD